MLKNLKPIFIENSGLPKLLSKISPVEVSAFSFAFLVFAKGVISEETKRHETIHFQQQLEMLFVFQWLFYLIFQLIGFIKYKDWRLSYYHNPFEAEAYDCANDPTYLSKRTRYNWVRFISY